MVLGWAKPYEECCLIVGVPVLHRHEALDGPNRSLIKDLMYTLKVTFIFKNSRANVTNVLEWQKDLIKVNQLKRYMENSIY